MTNADANTEREATTAQLIERGRLVCDVDWVSKVRQVDGGSKSDGLSRGGDGRERRERFEARLREDAIGRTQTNS